jgi:NAD(P)-dependent dehydrogenase (short-subunit alcohol dehydrogenase family)
VRAVGLIPSIGADHRNPVTPAHRPGGESQQVLIDANARRRQERDFECTCGPHIHNGGREMSERVAIVVGAGGDLGRATAQKLASAGLTVVGVDRNEEALKELPDAIRYVAGDPTDPAGAKSLVDQIAAEFGSPEVLVNTIGTYHLGEALTATPEDLRLMLDVNAGTALWLTQAVAPYMRERGSGAIVHVAARPGLEPTAGMATYSVSKAALVHLVRVLDLELRPLGIRVNAVAPQLLDTPKTRPYLPAELLAHAVSPEAVADLIVYLASDASAPVSGAIVPAYGP